MTFKTRACLFVAHYSAVQRYALLVSLVALLSIGWWFCSARSSFQRMRLLNQELKRLTNTQHPAGSSLLHTARTSIDALIEQAIARQLHITTINSGTVLHGKQNSLIVPLEISCSGDFFQFIAWYNELQGNPALCTIRFSLQRNNQTAPAELACTLALRLCILPPATSTS